MLRPYYDPDLIPDETKPTDWRSFGEPIKAYQGSVWVDHLKKWVRVWIPTLFGDKKGTVMFAKTNLDNYKPHRLLDQACMYTHPRPRPENGATEQRNGK